MQPKKFSRAHSDDIAGTYGSRTLVASPARLFGWLSVTTHQAIGMRYIVTAFIFLFGRD